MRRSPEADASLPLAEALQRCVGVCDETLEAYRGNEQAITGRVFSSVMLGVAALERVVDAGQDDPVREVSLTIASSVCREAAQVVRGHGLDEQLLRCADACERAAHLCESALASRR